MKGLTGLLGMAIACILGAGEALACKCEAITPEAGFERAQYVFTGEVIKADHHAWLISVDRVWKGQEKLARTIKLMDIHNKTDCEFFFALDRSYIFFAIIAKSGREVFYHPLVCNWTRPLRSSRVATTDNQSLLIEDFIAREYGPGEPPRELR